MDSRPTTKLVLVIANSYVDEQMDEFESKRPGTDRLCFLALIFPEITPFMITS